MSNVKVDTKIDGRLEEREYSARLASIADFSDTRCVSKPSPTRTLMESASASSSSTVKPAYTPQRVRRGMKTDRVNWGDLQKYQPQVFCDDCIHFDAPQKHCTMGYAPLHTRSEQMAQYELTGEMAFCRFCEIN